MSEAPLISDCLAAVNSVVLGKETVVKLALAAFFARGSILIEDRPGLGKTTLAKTLSRVLGLSFQRIQCTNDLLPMDILGRFDYVKDPPRFIEGPIFASIVILDELNRAPARTQSAFLQAMEEGEVTLEGKTYPLPRPQMFVGTQNPSDRSVLVFCRSRNWIDLPSICKSAIQTMKVKRAFCGACPRVSSPTQKKS